VDDLFAHIDWRPKRFEGDAHHINGANNTRAKPPRLQKQQGLSFSA
jgi:hypothetical protein